MTFFASVKKYGHYGYVVEDPDASQNRIFIENQAFDLETLTPIPNATFEFQNAAFQTTMLSGGNFSETPVVLTQGKCGTSWTATRNFWQGGIGRTDSWLSVLDYNNPDSMYSRAFKVPGFAQQEKTQNFYAVFYPKDISTNDLRSDFWTGSDLAGPATNVTVSSSLFITPVAVKQDGTVMYITLDNDTQGVGYFSGTEAAPAITNLRSTSSVTVFYIGEGATFSSESSSYFVEVNTTNHNYDIYAYTARGNVSTSQLNVPGSVTNIIYQYPSNLKDSSSSRVVFYSSHFNASNILSPKRIVWNKNSGTFTSTDCTMTYPGSNTYSTYASPPSYLLANYTTTGSNNYWMKPHLFLKNGTWYITFCTLEKCIKAFANERWTTALSRTWVTYSIGSGLNDHQLTFHSALSWSSTDAFPRSWMPINAAGDSMFIVQTGTVCTINFDTTSGWVISNTENNDARAYGQDSTGRIFYVTRTIENNLSATLTGPTAEQYGTLGYNCIHVYDPNIPSANVVITMDNGNDIFTGSNVSANCYVSAFADNTEVSTVTTGVRVANEATLTTSASHGLTTGDVVDIFVSVPAFVQSNATITVLSPTTFKYVNYGPEQASTGVTGTIRKQGARIEANLVLHIQGNSMVFSSNSASSLPITTSTSADVTVPLTIISAGQSILTASFS